MELYLWGNCNPYEECFIIVYSVEAKLAWIYYVKQYWFLDEALFPKDKCNIQKYLVLSEPRSHRAIATLSSIDH
jgi:hypothetical protein